MVSKRRENVQNTVVVYTTATSDDMSSCRDSTTNRSLHDTTCLEGLEAYMYCDKSLELWVQIQGSFTGMFGGSYPHHCFTMYNVVYSCDVLDYRRSILRK